MPAQYQCGTIGGETLTCEDGPEIHSSPGAGCLRSVLAFRVYGQEGWITRILGWYRGEEESGTPILHDPARDGTEGVPSCYECARAWAEGLGSDLHFALREEGGCDC